MSKIALVTGANRGIGLGIVKSLLSSGENAKVFATYREEERSQELLNLIAQYSEVLECLVFDASKEDDYAKLHQALKGKVQHLDLCMNSIGILDNGITFPERKLEDLSFASLNSAFMNNCAPSLLLAKVLKPLLLKSEAPKFIAVSAKVGSISDNQLGGWYSYRISKAALNMAIKNMSIEFKRHHKQSCFAVIHPGTTDTDLSKPFLKNASKKYTIHTPESSGNNIVKVVNGLDAGQTGTFHSWDASPIPW